MRSNSAKKVFIWSLVLAIFTISEGIYAQSARKNDVILRRDSTRIQALILQMSYEKINYRDLGTRDSAKTYISLDQVARVYLKNGKIINVRDSVLAGLFLLTVWGNMPMRQIYRQTNLTKVW